jgi:hypothetical protein
VNYRERPELSQSSLKKLLQHPSEFKYKKKKSSEALSIGSGVDCLLLTPDLFFKEYFVGDAPAPPEAIRNILNQLYTNMNILNVPVSVDEEIIKIARGMSYRMSNSDEVVLNKVNEHFHYYRFLVESKGRKVISPADYELWTKVVEYVEQDSLWKQFVTDRSGETFNQVEIYWNYNDIALKSLLDVVIVDHKNKIVYPIDLKTTSLPLSGFLRRSGAFYKFDYPFQGAFYTSSLKEDFKGYTIDPFVFYVVDIVNMTSMVYRCSESLLEEHTERWKKSIELYKWHSEKDQWDYKKEEYESGRVVEVLGETEFNY